VQTTPFSSFKALEPLMDRLHDQRFDADTVSHDQETRQWTARFLRRDYDSTRTVRQRTGLFRSRCFFPVVETTLVVKNVTAVREGIYRNARSDTFIGCEATPSGFRLRCALFIDIELDIDGPIIGEVRERDLERRGYVDTFLGAERILRLEGLE